MNIDKQTGRTPSAPVWIGSLCFLIAIPWMAHTLFSWMGFAPAYTGELIASSARILQGQTPHTDFILRHTAFSSWLHIPELILGGDHVYMTSRMVSWLELTVAAWATGLMLCRMLGRRNLWILPAMGLTIFSFNAHTFPVDASCVIDSMMFAGLGMMLLTFRAAGIQALGSCLLGCACLCRSTFLPVAPVALFVMNGWKRPANWAAMLLPLTGWAYYLLMTDSTYYAFAQIDDWRECLWSWHLLTRYSGFAMGSYLSLRLTFGTPPIFFPFKKRAARVILGILLMWAFPVYLSLSALYGGRMANYGSISLALCWTLAGAWIYLLVDRHASPTPYRRVIPAALLLAWGASTITGGYLPHVAPASGILFLTTLLLSVEPWAAQRTRTLVLLTAAVVSFLAFAHGRMEHTFPCEPIENLTCRIDSKLHGTGGLRTDKKTRETIRDLVELVNETHARGETCVILPGFPGYWLSGSRENPLSIDQALSQQVFPDPPAHVLDRIETELDAMDPPPTVLIAKTCLWRGHYRHSYASRLVQRIRKTHRHVGTTDHFYVYVKKKP